MSIIDDIKSVPEEQKYSAFEFFLQKKAREQKIPLSVFFELTPVCNLSCKMCYSRLTPAEAQAQGGILSGDKWIDLAQQAAELGAYYIVFTGGECTLHPEFRRIYKAAYDTGVKICVMTNATQIDKSLLDFFLEYPPFAISMTMYGFSAESYERTCKNGAAFQQTINAIEMISKTPIPLQIKCTLTKDMVNDLPDIYHYAKEKAAKFMCGNVLMTNREACGRDCEDLSVDEATLKSKLIELAAADGQEYKEPPELEIDERFEQHPIGMQCGAGRSTCCVNWRGLLTPCNTCDIFGVDMRKESMSDGWRKIVAWADTIPQLTECQTCKYQNRCRHCVFVHYGDTHEFGVPSPRLCYKKQHGITD